MVPSKSKFVFVDKIKAFKGSDASNVYDEEPADDELEFSDDEAEAAYKSRMKRKCVFFLPVSLAFYRQALQTRRGSCTFSCSV